MKNRNIAVFRNNHLQIEEVNRYNILALYENSGYKPSKYNGFNDKCKPQMHSICIRDFEDLFQKEHVSFQQIPNDEFLQLKKNYNYDKNKTKSKFDISKTDTTAINIGLDESREHVTVDLNNKISHLPTIVESIDNFNETVKQKNYC